MPPINVIINTTLAWPFGSESSPKRAIARGPTGTIWVAYEDDNAPFDIILISYSIDGGLTWTEETAVVNADAEIGTDGFAMVVDSSDIPHIFWLTRVGGIGFRRRIQHAHRTGGIWAEETVYTGLVFCTYFRAAIDSSDIIHLIWDDATPSYITGTTGAWSAREDITLLNRFASADLDVSATGIPYVVYQQSWAPWSLVLTHRTGGVWSAPEVISIADSVFPSISFDLTGQLHVAWQGRPGPWNIIQYRKRSATGVWGPIIDAVDDWDGFFDAEPCSLAVTSDNNAFIIVQKDDHGGDEAVYYKEVRADETIGALTVWDNALLRPNNQNSVYTSLFHGGSAYSLIESACHPVAILLNENGWSADAHFESQAPIPPPGPVVPTVQTLPVTTLGIQVATLNGTLTDDGGEACACGFQWGKAVPYASTTPTQSRTTGQTFSQIIAPLEPATVYHFRAFATNSAGTAYGADIEIRTYPALSRAYSLSKEEL